MPIHKYVKRAVTISAIQWNGYNVDEIKQFATNNRAWFSENSDERMPNRYTLSIVTLEGELFASVGDYIIRGVQGEFYPCKPEIFEQTYDPLE